MAYKVLEVAQVCGCSKPDPGQEQLPELRDLGLGDALVIICDFIDYLPLTRTIVIV